MRTAIFVGSFDPFTIGHDDIAKRALAIVDKLVIGVGINEHKTYSRSAEERIGTIAQLYAGEPRIEVMGFSERQFNPRARTGAFRSGCEGLHSSPPGDGGARMTVQDSNQST